MVKYRRAAHSKPRSTHSKPKFLEDKLDFQKIALLKQEYPKWLAIKRSKLGHDPEFEMQLLHDFVTHLGTVDKDFKRIKPSTMLKTNDKGTLAIYDFIRKRLGQQDEKLAPSTKAKPPTPAKRQREEAKDQDAVKVTGTRIPGHIEEKGVLFRQRK